VDIGIADSTRVGTSFFFEDALHRQGVHDGSQHSHVIGGGPLDTAGGFGNAAKDIAAADDQADFHALLMDGPDFPGNPLDNGGVETEIPVSHQSFAGQLEQYPAIGRFRGLISAHAAVPFSS